MRIVEVNRCAITPKFLKRRRPERADFDELIEEPCELREGGVLRAKLIAFDTPGARELEELVRTISFNGGTRTMGMAQSAKVFGYQPRNEVYMNAIACRRASLASEAPEVHAAIEEQGKWMTERYREFGGDIFKHHEETMKLVRSDWRMPGSVYTSGIVNENNALAYHYDSGNFRDCWSGMIVLPHRITGGELVLPSYRVAFRFSKPAAFFFDGQSLLHGVTTIQRPKMGYRYSLVYYSLLKLWKCLSPAEELEEAKTTRTRREQRRLLYSKGLANPNDFAGKKRS